jgi:beta-lactam-binding protein with PASTA domain/tRNA A-37 threonylcarbamoyl transferase component Bud32
VAGIGDDALVGRVLDGRYLVGERIARGGMASVFKATDQRLGREVAVKVMHHGLGDEPTFTQRFEREAQAAAQLNHRHVVSVFDQGTDGEITYLVMEYVPGRTLRDLMRDETPMKPARALELLGQVLVALSAAHAAHLIHRDIKPENVLITPDGDVKVADFGLARAVSAATTATGGTLIGTVSYLAPEIVVNEGADARSDVYACGAMLYEMLTGEKPHTGESPIQVAYKHVHEDVGPPSKVQPGLPPYIDALVARATCRDRDQRSADARVLLQQVRLVQRALEEGLEDDPDLTADLLPAPTHHQPAGVEEDTEQVKIPAGAIAAGSSMAAVATASASTALDDALTEKVERTGDDGPPEHTVQWGADAEPVPVPRGLHPPMTVEQYRESREGEQRSRRGRLMLVGVIVATALAVALGWYVGIGRYQEAPLLKGMAEAQAIDVAEEAGFKFTVAKRTFSETAPLGTVISTDPEPGSRILPGDTIEGVISQGKERYEIPDLKGRTLDEAEVALDKLRLEVGEVSTAFSEKIDKGKVIKAEDFRVGTEVKKGTPVDLVVSKGRKPIDITDYTGRPASDATSGLEKAGFKVEIERHYSDAVAKGRVIGQTPSGGTGFKNDTITLEVSRGPEAITVPNVVGKPRNEATKILKDDGFEVRAFGPGNFTVRAQTPGANSKAKVGSTITLAGF